MAEMGFSNLGSPQIVGSMDMTRVARWLGSPTITPLQQQARLSCYSAMCTISRSAWKKVMILQLEMDTRHKIESKQIKLKHLKYCLKLFKLIQWDGVL